MFNFLTESDKSDEMLREIEAAKKARDEEAQKQAVRLDPTNDSIPEELKEISDEVEGRRFGEVVSLERQEILGGQEIRERRWSV